MVSAALKRTAKFILPRFVRQFVRNIVDRSTAIQRTDYQGVTTMHNVRSLHEGRFAEIHDKHVQILHAKTENSFRLRAYFLCMLAQQASKTRGDFVEIGISFGIANHIIYDFVDFPSLGKTCHYVDPFKGDDGHGAIKSNYNTDIRKVREQYPAGSPIRFHEVFVPQALPLPGVEHISFAYLNTGAHEAESACLEWLYEQMSPGGIMVIDNYAVFHGYQDIYDPVIKAIGVEIFTLPTGQGVIYK